MKHIRESIFEQVYKNLNNDRLTNKTFLVSLSKELQQMEITNNEKNNIDFGLPGASDHISFRNSN
jgi:hypothetical protein